MTGREGVRIRPGAVYPIRTAPTLPTEPAMPATPRQRAGGWFAEQGDDQAAPYNWRAVLQLDGMVMPTDGPWFRSERECLEFIREDVLERGMFRERDR